MSRLVKKVNVGNGFVYESYSVLDYNYSEYNKLASVKYIHAFLDDTNVISYEMLEQSLYDDFNYSMVVDPNWNSTSTPPKPEGFNIDDIGTWGNITFDEIPMVKKYLSQALTQFKLNNDKYGITEAFLRTLSELGELPKIGSNEDTDWIIK